MHVAVGWSLFDFKRGRKKWCGDTRRVSSILLAASTAIRITVLRLFACPLARLSPRASSPRGGGAGFGAHSWHFLPQGPETFPRAKEERYETLVCCSEANFPRISTFSRASSAFYSVTTRGSELTAHAQNCPLFSAHSNLHDYIRDPGHEADAC